MFKQYSVVWSRSIMHFTYNLFFFLIEFLKAGESHGFPSLYFGKALSYSHISLLKKKYSNGIFSIDRWDQIIPIHLSDGCNKFFFVPFAIYLSHDKSVYL